MFPIRAARGSQEPALVMMTDSGSWDLRKKTVPRAPMKREQNPVEKINNDRLPTKLRMIVPTVVPEIC